MTDHISNESWAFHRPATLDAVKSCFIIRLSLHKKIFLFASISNHLGFIFLCISFVFIILQNDAFADEISAHTQTSTAGVKKGKKTRSDFAI